MKSKVQWNEAIASLKKGSINGFEIIYILSYKDAYRKIFSIMGNEKDTWDVLYHVYMEVYERIMELPEGQEGKRWILSLSEKWSYKMLKEWERPVYKKKGKLKFNISEEKATTVILRIEEELGVLTEQEVESHQFVTIVKIIITVSLILACSFFIYKIYSIVHKSTQTNQNFVFEIRKENYSLEYSEDGFGSTEGEASSETEPESIMHVIESGWGVDDQGYLYLIDNQFKNVIGKYSEDSHEFYFDEQGILVSLKNIEKDYSSLENTIQVKGSWIYYLLPSESRNTYDLYRVTENDKFKSWKECVIENISDYYVLDEQLIYMQNGQIQIVHDILNQKFLLSEQSLNLIKQEDGFFMVNELGYIVNEELKDTHMQIEDRIYRIIGGRVKYVKQNILPIKGVSFYINSQDSFLYWKNTKGENGRFVGEGLFINSYCVVEDWVYYSVCTRSEDNKRYSEIRRIKTDGSVRENVSDEFPGNMLNMYYYQSTGEIYAEYIPEKSQYGQIAVISLSGNISVILDENERSGVQTTGEDMLELISVNGDQIFCYWHDCDWKSRNGVKILWTKPIILSNRNRILLKD